MRLSFLVGFLTEMNAAIDTGKYQEISVLEVEKHIEANDLISFLNERLGEDVDLSTFTESSDREKELNERFLDLLKVYHGQEKRKWGVKNSGLCLLVAWTAEIIVGKKWD